MPSPTRTNKLVSQDLINAVKAESKSSEVIVRLLEAHGADKIKLRGGGNGSCICPFHRSENGLPEKHPSFTFNQNGVWNCFSCAEKGADGIALFARLNDMDAASDFIKIVKQMAGFLGLSEDPDFKYEPSNVHGSVIPKNDRYLTWKEQEEFHGFYAEIINNIDPQASANGLKWIVESRGILEEVARKNGQYFYLTKDTIQQLNHVIKGLPKNDLNKLITIGVINTDAPDLPRSHFYDEGVVFATTGDAGQILDLRLRLFHGDTRYLSTYKQGMHDDNGMKIKPMSIPFGVSILKDCEARRGKLLIVEGAVKALGAQCLGHFAIATNGRPGFKDVENVRDDSGQAKMLKPLIKRLSRMDEVIVCADNDQNPDADKLNISHAWELAKFLQINGVRNSSAQRTSVVSRGFCGDNPYVCKITGEVFYNFTKDFDDACVRIANGVVPQVYPDADLSKLTLKFNQR